MFCRIALFALLVACASAFMPASPMASKLSARSSELKMVIGLPYKPVFSYEWGVEISDKQKKATDDAKSKLKKDLPAQRVHIGYKNAKKNTVAIEVVSEKFEGMSESARTSFVMGALGDASFTVDELYTITYKEKFVMGIQKAIPGTQVFDASVQSKGFGEAELEKKIAEMTKEAAASCSPEVQESMKSMA
ncbi:unnamed protein product [Heterosigma akashiwo]|mmetsp:Transcript_24892/g.34425  ORF Transcript_24892/g.34425 Transcript_24892/m.34425 type:complete len:191 (+) Transcript_24892:64-636(+)